MGTSPSLLMVPNGDDDDATFSAILLSCISSPSSISSCNDNDIDIPPVISIPYNDDDDDGGDGNGDDDSVMSMSLVDTCLYWRNDDIDDDAIVININISNNY